MIELILSIPESVRDDTEICLEILRKGYHPNSVHMIDAAQEARKVQHPALLLNANQERGDTTSKGARVAGLEGYTTSGLIEELERRQKVFDRFREEFNDYWRRIMDATEKISQMMIRCGLATGHGDTIDDLIFELEKQIKNTLHAFSDARAEIEKLRKILSTVLEACEDVNSPDRKVRREITRTVREALKENE
jgi:hypothetical protein